MSELGVRVAATMPARIGVNDRRRQMWDRVQQRMAS
jgi:hypothetical protein